VDHATPIEEAPPSPKELEGTYQSIFDE